jgi:acetyl-CoA acetyltransferase
VHQLGSGEAVVQFDQIEVASYQKRFTLEQIMNDVMIAYPNTRPMCSANCDGAAAAVVCTSVVGDLDVSTSIPAAYRRISPRERARPAAPRRPLRAARLGRR